jgi:hypothetical protein
VRIDGIRIEAGARVWTPWPGWTAALVELTAPDAGLGSPCALRAETRASRKAWSA